MMTKQVLIEKLKNKNYKMTKQRKIVIEALLVHQDKLMSVENILNYVTSKLCSTNITTVYRNLEALEAIGVLHKMVSDDQMSYYKLQCTQYHHHHLICKKCGKIIPIDYCPMSFLNELFSREDFAVESHKLEIYGKCRDCQ